MNTKNKNKFVRFISGLLIPVILAGQIISSPVALAQAGLFGNTQNEPTEVTSLIAVLVEDSLIEDNNQYKGLTLDYPDQLEGLTLRDRINRYARDAQLSQPFTRSLIIRVKKDDNPVDIAEALETLYKKGDSADEKESKLDGVVLVGDVPLPVVNKNGYRFVSIFPYTDLEDKAYIHDTKTNSFTRNDEVLSPKVEVWHGVITPPADGQDGMNQLAYYFDKNHMFHIGHSDFSQFDRKMLYADSIWEKELMDKSGFPRYENYSKYLEDLSYMRFTKTLLRKMIEDLSPQEGDGVDDDFDGFVDEDLANNLDDDGDGAIDEDGGVNPEYIDPELFNDLPDVQSRNIILSYALSFDKILNGYLQNTNDLVQGLGRYDSYDSLVSIITTKDLHTKEYLKLLNDKIETRVDDIVVKLQENIPMIEESQLTGTITYNDNSTANLAAINFINQPKYPFGVGSVMYFNGQAMTNLTSAEQCTLYLGSNSTEDTVGQLVESNRLYNPETTDQSTAGYELCYGGSAEHPERCFPERLVKPVFDILGTAIKENVPESAVSYGGCYEFKEAIRYQDYTAEVDQYLTALSVASTEEQKAAIPLPGSKFKSAESIILQVSPLITLKDILDIYGGFDGRDNDNDGDIDEEDEYSIEYRIDPQDSYTLGREILANRKTHFVILSPPFANVKQIELDVTQTTDPFSFEIPSVTFHKEPTLNTIQKQLESGFTDALPVNNPHYTAFMDQDGKYQRIDYPNAFRAESGEDLLQQLADLEGYLMNLPGYSPTIVEVDGVLTELLAEEEGVLNDYGITQADDAVRWRNYGIDQKHAYAVRAFIDRDYDSYIGETEKGYEYMYFTAEGDSNEIEFSLNEESTVVDNDSEWLNPEAQLDEELFEEEEDESDDDGKGVLLPLWFGYIVEYVSKLPNLTKGLTFGPSCGEGDNSVANFFEDLDKDGDGIPDTDDNGDGIPNGAKNTAALLLTLEDNRQSIATDSTESYDITVQTVDSAGNPVTTDSFTEVQLEIVQSEDNPKAMTNGPDNTRVVGGDGSFGIIATGAPGEFSLIAHSLNRPAKVVSNTLQLRSEERRVRVLTYTTEIIEPPSFTEEVLQDYVVQDNHGNDIAEIDSETGRIIVKDENYELEVFESLPNKPMRIGIIEVQSGDVIASIVIIPQEIQTPVNQASTYSLEENGLTLEGVHVKNISDNEYITTFVNDENGSMYILDNSGTHSKRIARITSEGKVFIADEYFISIKDSLALTEPYVFIIEDSAGTDIAEFFISYSFGSLQLQEETDQLEEFNILSAVIKLIAKKAYAQSSTSDDSDGDGLTDFEELFVGTNLKQQDSDGDGFTDGDELQNGYDPLKKDAQLFEDLDKNHSAYPAFTELLKKGIVTRTDGNKIRPDELISREEFVQMVLGITCTNCSSFSEKTKQEVHEQYFKAPFPDTDVSSVYLSCVEEAKNQNIVSGYASGADTGFFKPHYAISRAEATKVVLEAAGIESSSYVKAGTPWYYQYALKGQEEEIFPKQTDPILYAVTYASSEDFKIWTDNQLLVANNIFEQWMMSSITRAEFALMIQNVMQTFDCYEQDLDGDGLPDNLELYQYNTDSENADTDGGGLDDLSEILQGKDPLNPADDLINDKDFDGMTDEWEEEHDLDPYDPADASFDNDKDGLINLHEFERDTDPRNPDSDGGSVQDGDEVWLQNTDPLSKEDDIDDDLLDSGLYAIGNTITRDIVYQTVVEGEAEEIPIYIDTMNADGEARLFLTAEILDGNGDIVIDDNSSIIEFEIRDSSTTDAIIEQHKVRVNEGVALTEIKSTIIAGLVDVDARIVGNDLPTQERQVFLQPLEPVEITVEAKSPIIRSGGLSKTPLLITLLDKNQNISNNDFYEITVTLNGPGILDPNADLDPETDGTQLQSFEGMFIVDLISTDETGDIEINASLNQEIEDLSRFDTSTVVTSRDDIAIVITPDKEFLLAGEKESVALRAQAVDGSGQPLVGFNQPIVYKASSDALGYFTGEQVQQLSDGDSQIGFTASSKAGQLEITATAPGVDAGSSVVPILANDAYEVRLTTNQDTFDAASDLQLVARVYDQYGNFVNYEDTVPISFRVTDATSAYGEISGDEIVVTDDGAAVTVLSGKNLSGPVNVIAAAEGLISGTYNLNAVEKISGKDLAGDYPNVLYASMLGGSFGNTLQNGYAGGEMLFAGKTQAVTAMTTEVKPPKPLVYVNNNGGLDILDDAQVAVSFIPANANFVPNRAIISNPDTQESIAELFFVYPSDMSIVHQDSLFEDTLQEGIFIKQQTDDELYEFKKQAKRLAITYDGNEVLSISDSGNINISDNFYTVELNETDSPFLAVTVYRGDDTIADIVFAQNIGNSVNIVDDNFVYQIGFPYQPGVYVKPLMPGSNYEVKAAFADISTYYVQGAQIVNTDLDIPADQAPGFSYSSFGRVFDEQGIGLDGDNKHVLFFAAGENVGNANMVYASEIGINLGDPTISIRNETLAGSSGFTQDIGKPLYYSENEVHEIMLSDYNNDSLTDILIAHENGEIRLLQNQLSAKQFADKGLLLNVASGINSADAADFNNDGYDDILIATKESCVGTEVCLYLYENFEGQFVRKHLDLDIEDKLSAIKIGDMNNDDFPDIVLAEFNGNIKIYYNNFGEIETEGQLLENIGISVDRNVDLKNEVLIHYDGMSLEDNSTLDDDFDYKTLQLKTKPASENEFVSPSEQAVLEQFGATDKDFMTTENVEFVYMDKDPVFGNTASFKKGIDLNGDTLSLDDKIVYTLTLLNNSPTDIDNIMISDILPDTLELDVSSIQCVDCEEDIELLETGQSLRPYVITGLSIPAGESRTITYETKITSVPGFSIDINSNFDAPYTKDEYLDINVNPEGNSSGKLLFFYSVDKDPETGHMNYAQYVSELEPGEAAEIPPYDETDDNNNGVPDEIEDMYEEMTSEDNDGDGIPNSWDDVDGALDDVNKAVEAVLNKLTCNAGGCIPTPINIAFLAPGQFNVMGTPAGIDPGTPVFVYGAVKIFLSPTLTGSLGNSVCVAGQCWSVAIPLIPPGVCNEIQEKMTNAMAKVSKFTSSASTGTTLLSGEGMNTANNPLAVRSENAGIKGSALLGSYQVNSSGKTNFKVPGFANVLTDWFSRQLEEITVKLSDLPDLYVIYPDVRTLVSDVPPEPEFKNFTDVLTYVNKLPLVQLESKSILIKVPALTQKEIIKMQTELRNWVKDAKKEIDRAEKVWKCDNKNSADKTICEKLLVDANKTIKSVEKNIKILEEYKKLPRKILEWRNIQVKYIYQVICYLDTIVQYMGGYIKKQETRIKLWIDMVKKIKKILETWKVVNSIMVKYQTSCGTCKSERYSLMEMLMKVFVVIPEIPIIPFPKWPDFYFDFSQIQLGYKIIWPNVKFKAEPVILPTLPRLSLPEVPNLQFSLPAIPTLPAPPELPELPDLPPLPLPSLPDLPKPPEIPNINAGLKTTIGTLAKILKLLCLIKKGFIPVNEAQLKTQIESMTARPLKATLPIDTLFKFQSPQISYPALEKIKINTKVDLRIETDEIYVGANEVAKVWNSLVTDLFEKLGEVTDVVEDVGGAITNPEIPTTGTIDVDITYAPEDIVNEWQETIAFIIEESEKQQAYIDSQPESYNLVAEQTFIDPSDAALNRHIEEIKATIETENLPNLVANNQLTGLRNALVAYATDEAKLGNQLKSTTNLDTLTLLAQNYPSLDNYISTKKVASSEPIGASFKQPKEQQGLHEIEELAQNIINENKKQLVALNTNAISPNVVDADEASNPTSGEHLRGLFVYNANEGVNEKILKYEGEITYKHNAKFIDIDEDDDEDIIYSYGGNVYLKENYKNQKDSKYLKYNATNPQVHTLAEFVPFLSSVNGFTATYDSGIGADFSWNPDQTGNLSGYEIVYKDNRQEIDNPSASPSNKINIIERPSSITTIGRIRKDIEITAIEGSFTVNGESTSLYTFGDAIETSNDSNTKVIITFSDSSQIELGPSADITLPEYSPGNFAITVNEGDALFKSNFFRNLFLQEGSSVINDNANVQLEYKNGDTIALDPSTRFFSTHSEEGYAYVKDVTGEAILNALPRTVVTSSLSGQTVQKGHVIHTLEDSVFVLKPENEEDQIFTLSANTLFPISQNYVGEIEIDVHEGAVEIIDQQKERIDDIPLQKGMFVQFDDIIEVSSGQVVIAYSSGAETFVNQGDTFDLRELTDPDNPYISIDIEEGNYYGYISTFDRNGSRSNPSEIELFAPQLCSDNDTPFAEAGPSNKEVIIFQKLILDASKSFDASGEIVKFYVDLNSDEDADGDDDPTNDEDLINEDPTTPTFELGPFEEVGLQRIALNVVDASGNIGKQLIEINVIVPNITLNESSTYSEKITGSIDPKAEEVPITLVRNRSGIVKYLTNALTNEDGEFEITGLEYDDTILLQNSNGDTVAEIDDLTGRIVIVDDNYYVDVLEAVPPNMPTRIVVKEKGTELILLTILMIPDLNTDVTIDESDTVYTTESVADYEGVHVKSLDTLSNLTINSLPASDPNFTGAAEIRDTATNTRISIIDSGGNIYFLDNNLDLRLKAAQNAEDPIVIEMLNGVQPFADIYISINNGKHAEITTRTALNMPPELVIESDQDNDGMPDWFEFKYGFDAQNPGDAEEDADNDGLSNLEEYRLKTNPLDKDSDGDGFTDSEEIAFGQDPNEAATSPFADVDIDHPYYDSIVNLNQKNILRGELHDGKLYFNPDSSMARKDFTDIILKMLCIIPRPEAYQPPNLFSDMSFNAEALDYYYPVVKEAVLQGFITGYVGETDSATNLVPFKPDTAISRAEAVKIVLEALEQQKIITLKNLKISENEVWYAPYMRLGQDLRPVLIGESSLNETFIITAEEAQNPTDPITRAEFVAIADRVLQAFDCYLIDDDGDGMPSVWELTYGLNPFDPTDANLDPDNEGLINLDEYRFGTDPFDPDTDDGGTNDKDEVDHGTNPINFPEDDPFDDDNDGLSTQDEIDIYGTDPFDPDTDDGGVMDGLEVARGTDPLNPFDDLSAIDKDPRSGLEEGVYIVGETCNSCPCVSAIDHSADLIPGDTFFAVIATESLDKIFSKSNELIFKGLLNQ